MRSLLLIRSKNFARNSGRYYKNSASVEATPTLFNVQPSVRNAGYFKGGLRIAFYVNILQNEFLVLN